MGDCASDIYLEEQGKLKKPDLKKELDKMDNYRFEIIVSDGYQKIMVGLDKTGLDLEEMCDVFTGVLKAMGYVFDGNVGIYEEGLK
jgi:hypothetical protein